MCPSSIMSANAEKHVIVWWPRGARSGFVCVIVDLFSVVVYRDDCFPWC